MPILAQSIVERLDAALDAEGSDRYLFDQDYKPAINSAIEWIVAVFNAAFGARKISEESLQELTVVRVWQANAFSRISFDPAVVGHELWSILAVYPKPKLYPSNAINPLPAKHVSVFMPGLTFLKSDYSATRLTLEEWNENVNNVFMAGNEKITVGGLESYGYKNFVDYSSNVYQNPVNKEIEVRPAVGGEYVAITYLRKPNTINLVTDSVDLPGTITDMLFQKALNFVSYKQGDGTNIYGVTEKDISRLVSLMV